MLNAFSSRWLPSVSQQTNSSVRLFCFPYAGGGASLFRPWRSGLDDWVQVAPVLMPGRESRLFEQPYTSVKSIVAAFADDLSPCFLEPYALFGYSNGAIIAFELARELRRRDMPLPSRLIVAGRRAPHLQEPDAHIHALPDELFRASLAQLRGTPRDVLANEELMTLLTPMLRADFAVHETYIFQADEPLRCPITAIYGINDLDAGRADTELWAVHTSAGFNLESCSGDHFFIHSSLPSLLQHVTTALRESRQLHSRISTR